MSPFKRPSSEPNSEGWAKPAGSSLRHYVRNKATLCGAFAYLGPVRHETSGAELCEGCRARVAALESARFRVPK